MKWILTGEHSYEWLHLVKILIAVTIGYIASVWVFKESHVWTLVTIVVVMGPEMNLASHIKRSIARLIGTCLGAVLGVAILSFHFNSSAALPIIIAVSLLLLYLGILRTRWTMAGVLGLVTFFMVVLTPNSDWHMALDRSLEIMLGVMIVLLVSLLFYPIKSTHIIKRLMKSNSRLLSSLVRMTGVEKKLRFECSEIDRLDKKLLCNISELRQMIQNMSYGGQGRHKEQMELLLRRMTACYRYINYLEVTYRTHILPEAPEAVTQTVDRLEHTSALLLEQLFLAMAQGRPLTHYLKRFESLSRLFEEAIIGQAQTLDPSLHLALEAMRYTHLRLVRVIELIDLSLST